MGLLYLASESSNICVQGSVRNICDHLGLCDKTFKKAVEELQIYSLLYLSDTKTNLGANSFKYFPTFPPNTSFNQKELSDFLCRDALLSQRPFRDKKITVNQRMLMIAVRAIMDEFSIVTALHTVKLSALTGIPSRNILPNLIKLEATELIIPITGLNFKQSKKKYIWAYQPKFVTNPSEIKIQFDRNNYSEIRIVSLLARRNELEEQLYTLPQSDYRKRPDNCFNMRWAEIEGFLCQPFPTAPDVICNSLLEAIDADKYVWHKLERDGLLIYLDVLLQLAAIQILSSQASGVASDTYRKCADTESMIQSNLTFFPVTSSQKAALKRIMVPLSKMIATTVQNQIAHFTPELELSECQIRLESLKPLLTLHCCGSKKVSEAGIYILRYEESYKKKADDYVSQ